MIRFLLILSLLLAPCYALLSGPFFFGQQGVAASQSTAWTPASLTGLQIWLKASAISGADGDAVATWPDSSGNARNLTQGTAAARPTLKLSVYNGKACVRFDGVDDVLSVASQNLNATWGITDSVTVWLVSKTPDSANQRVFYWTSSSGANDFGSWHRFGGSVYWDFGNISGGGRINGAVSQNANLRAAVYYRSGSTGTVYVDGTSVLTSSGFSDSLDSGSGTLTVGPRSGEQYAADICEFGVINRAISGDERTSLNTYLSSTYGTP